MWWCTQICSPRPFLKPVNSCRGGLRFGVVWPCRMLTLETPVDSRPSMPTTDAGEDFMAAACVEVGRGGPGLRCVRPVWPSTRRSRISRRPCSLAKQIFLGLTCLIAYRPWLGFRVEMAGWFWGGRRVASWSGEGYPKLLGWPLRAWAVASRSFPQLPDASRCCLPMTSSKL